MYLQGEAKVATHFAVSVCISFPLRNRFQLVHIVVATHEYQCVVYHAEAVFLLNMLSSIFMPKSSYKGTACNEEMAREF
jgi:hypothetical protein